MYPSAQSVVTGITGLRIEPRCLENLEFTRLLSTEVFLEPHFWKHVPHSIVESLACGLARSCKLLGVWKQIGSATKVSLSQREAKNMTPLHRELLQELQSFAQTAPTAQSLMESMAERLHEKMTRYNWVGFYLVDPADFNYLVVGPFAGSFTPNARIPLGTGLCGTAATSGQVIVVQDVSTDPRYLAGSPLVKSEIVVPIFVNKKLAGELDIESYFADTFSKSEQEFVEACAGLVASHLAKG
jgi:L-methionine (R)-S-oxide reductase